MTSHTCNLFLKGLCLTSGTKGVEMIACDAAKSAAQQFTLEENRNLRLSATNNTCLALEGGGKPNGGTIMTTCKHMYYGANEEFSLTNGQLCATALGSNDRLCLKPEATAPPHHPTGGGSGFDCKARCAIFDRNLR
jgi:hypothetical protein